MEEWRDIKGYEGLYKISNIGNIKSLARIINNKPSRLHFNGEIRQFKEKTLNNRYDNLGYQSISLTKNKKVYKIRVHRLIAEAFIPNPENKRTVIHKNGNKSDNGIKNDERMRVFKLLAV